MRTRIQRVFPWAALSAVWMLLASSASGYYYYVHFASRSAPFAAMPEKFDLNTLTNKSVPFLVSDQPPLLSPGDTYLAIVSEIRTAAKVWNDVATSDLRLVYGGLFTTGT